MSDTIDPTGLISSKTISFAIPNTEIDIGPGQNLIVNNSGQHTTYVVAGDASDNFFANAFLTITDAKHFNGSVDLLPYSYLHLSGVVADSYTFKGDTLTLYSGDKVLDKLTVSIPGSSGGALLIASDESRGGTDLTTGRVTPGFGITQILPHVGT